LKALAWILVIFVSFVTLLKYTVEQHGTGAVERYTTQNLNDGAWTISVGVVCNETA